VLTSLVKLLNVKAFAFGSGGVVLFFLQDKMSTRAEKKMNVTLMTHKFTKKSQQKTCQIYQAKC
jgi:hypothetical protein